MRILGLLLACSLGLAPSAIAVQAPEAAEGTPIASAQVSGIDIDRLSPGLRDIDALVGTPLNWGDVWELAARIEGERPGVAAAVRAIAVPKRRTRRLFRRPRRRRPRPRAEHQRALHHRTRGRRRRPEPGISPSLAGRHPGARRDQRRPRRAGEARRNGLRGELPGYDVDRRMSRGTQARASSAWNSTVRKGEELRWLHFAPSRSKFLFHSEQGWGGLARHPDRQSTTGA